MTDIILLAVGGCVILWLAILHITVTAHRDEITSQALKIQALENNVGRIQREARR